MSKFFKTINFGIYSDNEELISELDFESDNSSIYSLEDEIEEFF